MTSGKPSGDPPDHDPAPEPDAPHLDPEVGPGAAPDSRSGSGFLSRWSRRKSALRGKSTGGAPPQPEAPFGGARRADVQAAATAPPPVAEADLPTLDSLDENSDYSPFLAPGVSEALRRRALRKLFHSAAFNVVDGLDDYAEDYSSFVTLDASAAKAVWKRMERAANDERGSPEEAAAEDPESAGAARARSLPGASPEAPPDAATDAPAEGGRLGGQAAAAAGSAQDPPLEGESGAAEENPGGRPAPAAVAGPEADGAPPGPGPVPDAS